MSKLMVALFVVFGILGVMVYFRERTKPDIVPQTGERVTSGKIIAGTFDKSKLRSNTEWKKVLTPQQYYILRDKGTEIPFTGALESEKRKGTYYSVGCNEPVFRSEQRYDSGTGWPSFWDPIRKDTLVLRQEDTIGETRIEVMDRCGGHLGHVFDDGPEPTGKRYCINSAALKFVPDKE